ncbi:phage head morphogenesis protein [Candidatus Pacearchaeota archaeon]|jgi:hypothetical protein|nr:phage head morphogenesis protein [Candidatus Pacearchaeota archaeon]
MSEATILVGDESAELISLAFIAWAVSKSATSSSFDPTPFIRDAFYASGEAQIEEIGALVEIKTSFNIRSPQADAWIKKYAAKHIKYVDATKKQTIRQIVLRGFREGLTSQEQSKLIKEHIGLLPAHSNAVDNYRKNLLSSGMDTSSADTLTEKYRKKLLKYRADTIGLTEGHTAANEGYRFANREAVKRGILNPDKYEQYWIVTRDKRLCPICANLSNTRADLPNGQFPSPGGHGPPIHPRDRCTTGIRRK